MLCVSVFFQFTNNTLHLFQCIESNFPKNTFCRVNTIDGDKHIKVGYKYDNQHCVMCINMFYIRQGNLDIFTPFYVIVTYGIAYVYMPQ